MNNNVNAQDRTHQDKTWLEHLLSVSIHNQPKGEAHEQDPWHTREELKYLHLGKTYTKEKDGKKVPQYIEVKLPDHQGGTRWQQFSRRQGFEPEELDVADCYAKVSHEIAELEAHQSGETFGNLLRGSLVEFALAEHLVGQMQTETRVDPSWARTARDTVVRLFRYLKETAMSTNEGEAIEQTLVLQNKSMQQLGLDNSNGKDLESWANRQENQWAPNLGTLQDNAVMLSVDGRVYAVQQLSQSLGTPGDSTTDAAQSGLDEHYYPKSLEALARYTHQHHCLGFSIMPGGDIAVVIRGELRFIHRNGGWTTIAKNLYDQSFGDCRFHNDHRSAGEDVRHAMIASILDASCHRHGGLLAVVSNRKLHQSGGPADLREQFLRDCDSEEESQPPVQPENLWPSRGYKSGLVDFRYQLVRRGLDVEMGSPVKFHELSRTQRLELLCMDGATIINMHGEILAAGVTVKVGAADPGGRKAAAQKLGDYGCAFKISQDGEVTMYGRYWTPKESTSMEVSGEMNRFG